MYPPPQGKFNVEPYGKKIFKDNSDLKTWLEYAMDSPSWNVWVFFVNWKSKMAATAGYGLNIGQYWKMN